MNKTFLFKRQSWAVIAPLAIIVSCIVLAQFKFNNADQSALSTGITFDLLISAPLCYFLLIQKTKIPPITVVTLFILGIFIASKVIPNEQQTVLNLIKLWFVPFLELVLLVMIIRKVRKTVRSFKQQKSVHLDFFSALKIACRELIPQQKLATIFSTELAVFYYAFFSWKQEKLNQNTFTYHKNSATRALLIAFIFMILVETFVVHILLMRVSEIAAWTVSALSFYSAISLLGFLKSITQRRIVFQEEKVILPYGILSETEIHFANIEFVELSQKDFEADAVNRKLSPLGNLESHNVILHLKQEHTIFGLYGSNKKFKKLAFFVDEKELFKSRVEDFLRSKD